MTATAILLLVVSAFVHAGWNFIGKSRYPTPAFFLIASAVGAMLLAPVFLADLSRLGLFPATVWMWLLLTGGCQAIYYVGLAGAYRNGDMSVVYPLARSYPVLVVLAVTLVLGQRHAVSARAVLGVLLVVGGCLILPKRRFQEFRWRDYWNKAALMALLAACGSAGYSMIDDHTLRILRTRTDLNLSAARASLLYGGLEYWSTSVLLLLFVLLQRREREALSNDWRTGRRQAALMGIGICLAYTLVLVSMAFARNISYIVAFRQLSIPMGAILGVVFLHEPRHSPKAVGIVMMCIGLILVASG
jgi:drug/metabolite transporter (DMT)-like permease